MKDFIWFEAKNRRTCESTCWVFMMPSMNSWAASPVTKAPGGRKKRAQVSAQSWEVPCSQGRGWAYVCVRETEREVLMFAFWPWNISIQIFPHYAVLCASRSKDDVAFLRATSIFFWIVFHARFPFCQVCRWHFLDLTRRCQQNVSDTVQDSGFFLQRFLRVCGQKHWEAEAIQSSC